jgi:hypothetical protein
MQTTGFFGLLPFSDGKFYQNDIKKVSDVAGSRSATSANSWVTNLFSNVSEFKIIKDTKPSLQIDKKLNKQGFTLYTNDYVQIFPKEIHALSRFMTPGLEKYNNVTFNFDEEIVDIFHSKEGYKLITQYQREFLCKKIILATGKAGCKYATKVFKDFDIVQSDDIATYGLKLEINQNYMCDFNNSVCSIIHKDLDIEIPYIQNNGTMIPEDHVDFVTGSFRSNEKRWESENISFDVLGNRYHPNEGTKELDRICNLTFIVTEDRVRKEKLSMFMNGKAKISILEDYNWLKPVIEKLSNVIPDLINKAYFYSPVGFPIAPKINISKNLESDMEGLYVIGEAGNIRGLLSAALMGSIVADKIVK